MLTQTPKSRIEHSHEEHLPRTIPTVYGRLIHRNIYVESTNSRCGCDNYNSVIQFTLCITVGGEFCMHSDFVEIHWKHQNLIIFAMTKSRYYVYYLINFLNSLINLQGCSLRWRNIRSLHSG